MVLTEAQTETLYDNLCRMESTLIHMLDSGTITVKVADQLNSANRASMQLMEKMNESLPSTIRKSD